MTQKRTPNARLLFYGLYPNKEQEAKLYELRNRFLLPEKIVFTTGARGIVNKIMLDGMEVTARGRNQFNEYSPTKGFVYYNEGSWGLRMECILTPPTTVQPAVPALHG